MGRKVSQRNIGMYDPDWMEVDTLVEAYSISISAAMRIIVDHWRRTRDPSNNAQMTRLRELAESYLRENITDSEFATEAGILILVGNHSLETVPS